MFWIFHIKSHFKPDDWYYQRLFSWSWNNQRLYLQFSMRYQQEDGRTWKMYQHSLFLFMDLADLPSPSYYIRYVFLSSDIILYVFCCIVLVCWKSCIYSLSLPTYQLMNFQIAVKEALHPSLCMKEHMWEITESSVFYKCSHYLQYYHWNWCSLSLGT